MNIPLNPDLKDPIGILFSKVIKLIDSRTFQEELARNGFSSIEKHQTMLKIILLSSCFEMYVVDVFNEVKNRPKL